MTNKSIIFMGTPDFAVSSLLAIHKSGIEIKAVVTQPDKQRGRGKKVSFTPVKKTAIELGIPVLQPVKMRNKDFIEELNQLSADLFVVVAFRILPKKVLEIPPLGSINLHASLLPNYRGAAPINHALFN
ncbi:MAG: methionyl-tRNA formyltransferase, partial [Candidatus Delongbacteria bacterium]|nr:methionyl-tRNA formyltransferase [Candidatus Delongbacteria bacterium]